MRSGSTRHEGPDVDLCPRHSSRNGVPDVVVVPRLVPNRREIDRARHKSTRVRLFGVIGDFPAETVDADLAGQGTGPVHLCVVVIPDEQDVTPVQERKVAAGSPLLFGHRPEASGSPPRNDLVDVAFAVGFRRRTIDREGYFVDT